MSSSLSIQHGQFSDKGRKPVNQDFYGVFTPDSPLLSTKGIAIALADGISSSQVSQEASKTAVTCFFEDYYSTSESWSVKQSIQCVLKAINSWLYSQTRRSEYRYNLDKGYVCTLSGMVIKSATAHLFHVGDSQISMVHENSLEPLTEAHRVHVSSTQHYLQRAMGMDQLLEFDYAQVELNTGDMFLLCTDGIYEFLDEQTLASLCNDEAQSLDERAKTVVEKAMEAGSDDNVTCQIIKIESLPEREASEIYSAHAALPFPKVLNAREEFDGFTIVRPLYHSARSHVYLAVDNDSGEQAVLKAPSLELQADKDHLERFLIEEWIARRITSPHVLKPSTVNRSKQYFYIATEYIEGQTLSQWMIDNPKPNIQQVREIIEQIAKGLLSFHRREMLHQDLRPENIMIDYTGTVKIIDFGSTWVAGLEEISATVSRNRVLGTAQYTAPEYFIGEAGTPLSDQFSLAVITYQMLSGRLPYGAEVAKARTRKAQRRLNYKSVLDQDRETPAWVDFTLRRALHIDPSKRYEVISEFLSDLRQPSKAYENQTRAPLIERNPVVFWQSISLILFIIVVVLMVRN